MATGRLIDVVERFKEARESGTGATLFVGAGCSVKGGIPTSSGFLKIIEKHFPEVYEKAPAKTYPHCMSLLSPEDRQKIVNKCIESSRVNWAHVCIALLLQKGYVHRVLTTNFDPLLRRACSIFGLFPSVYDPTLGQLLKPDAISGQALVYLHGQHHGFSVMAARDRSAAYWDSLAGLLKSGDKGGPWVMAGYGGANDPVFEQLCKIGKFDGGLFWVGYRDETPPKHVREGLLPPGKGGVHIRGYDADSFFVALCQKLRIFPPEFMSRPFSHLDKMIRSLSPFPLAGQNEDLDITNATRIQMQIAINDMEPPGEGNGKLSHDALQKAKESPELLASLVTAQEQFMAGNLEGVMAQKAQFDKTPSPQLGELLAWAHVVSGNEKLERAQRENAIDRKIQHLKEACLEFQEALAMNPNMHQAYQQWGLTLLEQAKYAPEDELETLFAQAGEKFQKTISLKSDLAEAFYGWGYVLCMRGKTKKLVDKAGPFFDQAVQKFQQALEVKPEMVKAYYGWGSALLAHGRKASGQEAETLFKKSIETFQRALERVPDYPDALCQLGYLHLELSSTQSGKEADTLLIKSADFFQSALNLQPDLAEAASGWARVLWQRGRNQPEEVAESLYREAQEKFRLAAEEGMDDAESLCHWGELLIAQSGLKVHAAEVNKKLAQASDKFRKALELEPDCFEAINQLGRVQLELAQSKRGDERKTLLSEAVKQFEASVRLSPNNYTGLTQWGLTLLQLGELDPARREALATEAEVKLQEAVKINPEGHEALNQLGNLLMQKSQSASGDEAQSLFDQAVEKYKAALTIQPEYPEALAHWGQSILKSAQSKNGEEAEKLYAQAAEKMDAALEMNPDRVDTLISRGLIFMKQAQWKKGVNAHPLYAEARKRFQKAEDLRPGCAAYNMARLMAVLANETGCKQWLEKCNELGVLPDQDSLLNDPHLKTVRDSKWFKVLLYDAFMSKSEKPAEEQTAK